MTDSRVREALECLERVVELRRGVEIDPQQADIDKARSLLRDVVNDSGADPQMGDQVELSFEGEFVEEIDPPHGGSTRYRIDTDATAYPLVVYEHRVSFWDGDLDV